MMIMSPEIVFLVMLLLHVLPATFQVIDQVYFLFNLPLHV